MLSRNLPVKEDRGLRGRTWSRGAAAVVLLALVDGMELAVGPVAAAHHAADRIEGVWRLDGYGTVLSIEDGRLQEYQATAVSCLRGDTARRTGQGGSGSVSYTGDDATVYRIRPAAGGVGAILHFDGSVGDRRLLRLPALPASCAEAAPTGAPATFDVFWQTFEENYPFFAAKKIDWWAVRDRYRPRSTTVCPTPSCSPFCGRWCCRCTTRTWESTPVTPRASGRAALAP
ncbi:hypothetical protein [Streptomyces sp. GbtcB7]|uniref:hypothetical protein n=1 Tax=Streptomyces sp. GbtcB7 TaxID=2824752 RepID=UPI0027E3D5D3|nr:hypothetical protein [Streptomyces sp. GbtcB7]